MSNGSLVLAVIKPAPGAARAIKDGCFDENRVGLDRLWLGVASLADWEKAMRTLEERGIPHGKIEDLGGMGIRVSTFPDPGNMQIKRSAPKN